MLHVPRQARSALAYAPLSGRLVFWLVALLLSIPVWFVLPTLFRPSPALSASSGPYTAEPAGRESAISAATDIQLLLALNQPDAHVRQSAARLLGARRAFAAADALRAATYDPVPAVRAESVRALAAIDAFSALPRLVHLQMTDFDTGVRDAANRAEADMRSRIASAAGLGDGELLAVSQAPATPEVYAATASTLYALRDGAWQPVGRTPEPPSSFAVADSQAMFAGSLAHGLYRSLNGGQSWQLVQAGIPASERLTVSALLVDPVDTRRVYAAIASGIGAPTTGSAVVPMDAMVFPLGIYASPDGGDHWSVLAGAPMDAITRRLSVDPASPDYLYGLTDSGAWRVHVAH